MMQHVMWSTGKHGRCARGDAPASDAAWSGDARGTPLPARRATSCHVFFFFFFSRLSPTLRRLGPIRAESGRLRLYRAKPANSSPYSSFPTCRRLLEWTQAMAEAAAASPFFILSACPFQFYFKFSLPCFMFSFCFVNLARDWVLEMIKRFDKSFISMGPHVILIYE